MKTHNVVITALLGFALAACHKSEPVAETPAAPPQVSAETKLRAAYGFAAQVPADSEGYAAFYNLGKFWHGIKNSKTVASLRANPLWQQASQNPSFQQAHGQLSQNPDARKWRAILADALGNETLVSFSPGSAEKFKVMMQISDQMRIANIKSAIAGKKAPNTMHDDLGQAVVPYLKTLDVPPMIIGFKLSSQKAALVAELERAEKNLPPGVELTAFNFNGNLPFKSIVVTLGKVLPQQQQDALKQWLGTVVPDLKEADNTCQALLARHVEVAYGFVGDYLVASIGPDHSHLKLAANFGESLLSKPEIAVAANYADKPVLSFSWSSAELLAASQRCMELMPYYDSLKDDFVGSLSADDTQKLEADLKRLDGESAKIFSPEFTPMVGISYRDHGLRSEMFGGLKPVAGMGTVKFSSVPSASTFFWLDTQSNPLFGAAFRTWLEDFSATAYDEFQRLGLPNLPDQQRAQYNLFQSMAIPRIAEFYRITKDQFSKALGSESAIALDLAGPMPESPLIPPPIHDACKLPRLAYLSDVQDRALLGQSWAGYLKLARDIAQTIPQAALIPGGLPDPGTETVDGVTLSYYRPPLPTGDLLPNVATTDKTFVVSTSRSYSLDVSKAAAKPAANPKAPLADLRINFGPALDFADSWMATAAQYPDLFFRGDQAKAAEFKKSEPDLASLLHSLRSLEGIDMQIYDENGLRHASSAIRWHEQ